MEPSDQHGDGSRREGADGGEAAARGGEERHRGSEEAEREAKAVHAQLIEQMEKNYAVAQRVHEERARGEESDHFAKGLREQMRSATARAVSRVRAREGKGRKQQIAQ